MANVLLNVGTDNTKMSLIVHASLVRTLIVWFAMLKRNVILVLKDLKLV